MKARPILFQSDMVRAILDGRKTQTRRVVKLDERGKIRPPNMPPQWSMDPSDPSATKACPYGQPGDLLWVRETWAPLGALTHSDPGARALADRGFYRADEGTLKGEISRWRPSIHMPRWASRLTLRVTGVRVERLDDISESDARAEGVPDEDATTMPCRDGYGAVFSMLWEEIHGHGSWDENPWVWVIEFEPIRANVDEVLEAAA